MKYLLLIAAIMTLTSARTISSSDAGCCGGGACCPGACCMTMTRYVGQFDKGPRRETGGASLFVLNDAVMLSEAKHLGVFSGGRKSEMESLASRTSSAALQLRFAQNDIAVMRTFALAVLRPPFK